MLALSQMQAIVLGIPEVKVALNVLIHAPDVPEVLSCLGGGCEHNGTTTLLHLDDRRGFSCCRNLLLWEITLTCEGGWQSHKRWPVLIRHHIRSASHCGVQELREGGWDDICRIIIIPRLLWKT